MSEDLNHLRELRFGDLLEAKEEARALLERGYTCRGNWTLGQICRHLCLVQDPSIDGYPAWMSLFAFLRPAMRRFLLPRLMSGDSPKGIRTSRAFVPADEPTRPTQRSGGWSDMRWSDCMLPTQHTTFVFSSRTPIAPGPKREPDALQEFLLSFLARRFSC